MNSKEIDKEIDQLSQDGIDNLLASSYADKRCKIEVALVGTALFVALSLCVIHVGSYLGEARPPRSHKAFLFFMTLLVAPYAMIKFYKDVYASIVVRTTRRLFMRTKSQSGP